MSARSSFSSSAQNATVKGRLELTSSQISILESQTSRKKERRRWLLLEIAGISVVIVIIVALMSLPVVFFYLPMVGFTS